MQAIIIILFTAMTNTAGVCLNSTTTKGKSIDQ